MTDAHAEALLAVHKAALAGMKSTGPKQLARYTSFYGEDLAPASDVSEDAFRGALPSYHTEDPLLKLWRAQLTDWDFESSPTWTDSLPRTEARRDAVHDLLGLALETRKALDALVPVSKLTGEVVISRDTPPLWSAEKRNGRDWYWPSYRTYLEQKGWEADSVASLDNVTERIAERLADPTHEIAYQSRGLVVGYVQSGKTANFTGVIAKALDGGYRLVIVLGGTLNLLRGQTQRRLDMELVGRENILRGANEIDSDYYTDQAWLEDKFLRHNGLPSKRDGFDIDRLTTKDDDYKQLDQGIRALEFDKADRNRRLYDPVNLHRSAARLMVVKKNKSVLNKLVNDLRRIDSEILSEIPALIIDDESDEASVNTANPKKPNAERTAINSAISELLTVLPRAQYIGYTATPFANVFIDPADTADVFPRDFIVSLDRPHGYMGARDFHDFDLDPDEERTWANSQEKAHVRDVAGDEDDESLREAIDMFVLTAAVKLYRTDKQGLDRDHYRHHTMLVHESRLTAEHRELQMRIMRLWLTSDYTGERGRRRLKELFESDLLPASGARADGYAVPSSYEDLAPYIGMACHSIGGDDKPVIVVNGDKDIENRHADFDGTRIWKILIGGQKLSRGFTIEGLTVTYYRRQANNASTLMQMGRWFGFRKGYRDLVRLYIDRSEEGSKGVDLYEAFEAICLDEENFRDQLKQYSHTVDGHPQLTPAQVPPLVTQRMLKPVSRNKMYNTRLVEVRSPGQLVEPTAYPEKASHLRQNTQLWTPVLSGLSSTPTSFTYTDTENGKSFAFGALTGVVTPEALMGVLRSLQWCADNKFDPHLKYLEEITKSPLQVDDWLILAPQHKKRARLEAADRDLAWFSRKRRRGPLFGAIGEPKHRPIAYCVAGALPSSGDKATEQLMSERRGVVLLYPVVEPGEETIKGGIFDTGKLVMAFNFIAPAAAHGAGDELVRFTTIDSSLEDDAIIDAEEA